MAALTDSVSRRFVIIGNGIAGTTAAEQIRKGDPSAQITLVTNEPYPLYNRIALPPFLKQKVTQQKVMIRSLAWHEERAIQLLREETAVRVCVAEREVHLASGKVLPYDVLLIATGGRANPLPGAAKLRNIFNFQTLDDALAISAQIERSRHAVVVGGSYISYELTEAFRARGLHTTWVMRGPWFLRRVLDAEGGALVDRIAAHHGVEVIHGAEVAEVRGKDGEVREVVTTNGRVLPCELLGVGVGITRNVEFLEGTGIAITGGGVMTDEFLRTSVPNIFAAGDVAAYFDRYVGGHITMGTWDNATNHGKVVGQNMLGAYIPYDDVPTYSTTLFHNRIMAFGATPESNPEVESVVWLDEASESYRRLFFHGERLVGGVIIGQRKGFPKLLDMIKQRTPVHPSERAKVLTETLQ
jgi:NAD(P)H-nitrite reductase large subunit